MFVKCRGDLQEYQNLLCVLNVDTSAPFEKSQLSGACLRRGK